MLKRKKHKKILIRLLKDIYSDPSLGPFLGFKGDAAAFLFYNLPRFSVDLDFDLLNPEKEKQIYNKLRKLISKYGDIRDKKNKKNRILLSFSFEEKAQNIKVEVNKENFRSSYKIRDYLGVSMLVMKREDMFAHKLVAAYERKARANRDLYDIWFFAKEDWALNKEIIKERTGMNPDEFLKDLIFKIENKKGSFLEGLGELLSADQKRWVKDNLKKEVIFSLKLILKEG